LVFTKRLAKGVKRSILLKVKRSLKALALKPPLKVVPEKVIRLKIKKAAASST